MFFRNMYIMITQTGAQEILAQSKEFRELSIILFVFAALFGIISVIFWIVFKIPHEFSILTGFGARREIERIRQDSKASVVHKTTNLSRKRAVITWNTSAALISSHANEPAGKRKMAGEITAPMKTGHSGNSFFEEEKTILLENEEKTILLKDEKTMLLEEEKTILLKDAEDIDVSKESADESKTIS